jgi:peptidoglycan hydrolase-like protein with peptidoglycan-binding domain
MTIKQRQCLLAYLGYDTGGIDGVWGDKSKSATMQFQMEFGLDPDGVAWEQTEQALRHAVCYGMTEKNYVLDTGTFWDEIEYFTRDEFKCKCGGKYCNGFPHEPQEGMVRLADGARRHFGKPAIVISGLRDPIHNRNERGVDSSQHIYGEACDIQIPGVSADTLLNWFQSQPGVRYAYAINATNVHFDIPKGDR